MYRVLRQREKMDSSLELLAAEAGMSESRALCALHIFRELNLLEFSMTPLRYRLRKSGRVSLDSSRLRKELNHLKG